MFKKIFNIIVFSTSFLSYSVFSQISDHLKTPYLDLLKLNNSGQYKTAILQGKILISQYPSFPNAYIQLAKAFSMLEQTEQGKAYFNSLQVLNPGNPFNYYAIALIEKNSENSDSAIENLKKCIEINPRWEKSYFQLAEIYNKIGDLEVPRQFMHSILLKDTSNAAVYYGLGCIHLQKKEWKQGIKEFDKGIEIDPELADAYYYRGLMDFNLKNYKKSIEIWEKGKRRADKYNDVELMVLIDTRIGRAYGELNQFKEAVDYYEKALKSAHEIADKRQEVQRLIDLSEIYRIIGQSEKSIELLDQGIGMVSQMDEQELEEKLLASKGNAYWQIGQYNKGVECANDALKMAEVRNDSLSVAKYSTNMGVLHASMGNLKKALEYFERSAKIYKVKENQKDLCVVLGNLGYIYRAIGEVSTSIETLERALKIAVEIESKSDEHFILGNLGYAYWGLSDFKRANRYFHDAFLIADSIGEVTATGTYLGNIGVVYRMKGDFTSAIEYLNRALENDLTYNNSRNVIRHYSNMADIYNIRGNYMKALELQMKSLAISDSIGTQDYSAIVLGNLGLTYYEIGDFDKALMYYNRSIEITREVQLKDYQAVVLINRGSLYKETNREDLALKDFEEALQIAKEIGDKEKQYNALIAIATQHSKRKEYAIALDYYNRSLNTVKELDTKLDEAKIYLNIGELYFEKGELLNASSYYTKSLNLSRRLSAIEYIYKSLIGLASVMEKQGQNEEALQYYEEAIEKIESVRERLRIEPFKIKFMEQKFSVYESLIELLIRMKRFKKAYEYLQWFRVRSLLEMLHPERNDIKHGISPERFEKYREAEGNLRIMYDRLSVQYGQEQRNENVLSALTDSLELLRSEHERILEEIKMNHPSWAEITGNTDPLSVDQIQEGALESGTKLVEYFVGPEIVAVWIITGEGFHCEVIDLKRDELVAMVEKLRQPFREVKEGRITNLADVRYDLKTAQQLYKRIFLPVEKHVDKGDHLILVPDGVLHYIPFEALVIEKEKERSDPEVLFSQYEKVHYLLEKYPISYIPAVSILGMREQVQKSEAEKKGELLAFGSPDFGPFTKMVDGSNEDVLAIYKSSMGLDFSALDSRDAIEVSAIFSPSRLYLGKDATEERFKQEAKHFPHIYLSTHAVVNERQPMYSLVAFSQDDDPSEDGFLHTYEVFNMVLDADLVTLSACETGLGKLTRGEAIIGLTRGFLYAGASSIIVSLWSVEESSAKLMKDFYQLLKQGMPKAKALQNAKMKMIKTRINNISYSNPFLWAPFVLIER